VHLVFIGLVRDSVWFQRGTAEFNTRNFGESYVSLIFVVLGKSIRNYFNIAQECKVIITWDSCGKCLVRFPACV
jgi:hypothetical protein